MNNEYYQSQEPQHAANAAPASSIMRPAGIAAFVLVVGLAVVVFGVACIFGGMHLMKYIERLELLEKGGRQGVFRSYPLRDASRDAAPTAAEAAGSANPQIYFMMGPQGGAAMQTNPAAMEMNQFILNKYQQEFATYMRQRTMQPSSIMPRSVDALYSPFVGGSPADMPPQTYVSTDIAVPAKMTLDLKRRYSRNTVVEDWLNEEVSRQRETSTASRTGRDEGRAGSEPDMDSVLRSLAETTYADGQYERTSRVYAELAARGVSLTTQELMRWAKATELAGDRESAVRILELVLKNDPHNAEVLKEAAAMMLAGKNFSAAAEYYLKLMELQPGEREWRVWRAKTLTWSERGAEALELLRELYNENAGDKELDLMFAELLLSEHQFAEALPILDALIARNKADDSLKVRRMNALMGLHRFKDAAAAAADLLARNPDDTELMLKQAVNLVAAGSYTEAILPFTRYLSVNPNDIEVRKQLAEALMAAQRFSEAAVEYHKIAEVEPSDDELLKKIANAHMAAREYRAGAVIYAELAEIYPDDVEINTGLVTCLRESGQNEQALLAARRYLAYDPFDAPMLITAAELSLGMKNRKDALGWYRTALKLDPTNTKARVDFAGALMWDSQYEAAESEYRKALTFEPDDTPGRRGLARSLFYQRKYKESFSVYQVLAWEDPTDSITEEYAYRQAVANGKEAEAAKILANLQEMEPEDITWKADRHQSLLRQHRWPEARAQASVVVAQDRNNRPTRVGHANMNNYLTYWPVTLRMGLLRKSSSTSSNENDDRKAKLTHTFFGLHGEKSVTDHVRAYADLDREGFNMRESGVSNVSAFKLVLGGRFEGHPNLTGSADLGYRWFTGAAKKVYGEHRNVDDQWLYNLRADMREIGDTSLRVGFYSNRREHYDNYRNVYDNLYAYNFGLDASYRWRKWDFFGNLRASVLTDNNTALYAHADAKYRLYETPCLLLTVGGNVEYEGWNETRDTYYSPRDQYRIGAEVDGRYWLCRDSEAWGSPESYVDFGLSVFRDRFANWGQKVYVGFSHDYSTRLSVFARADLTRESYYNEVKLIAGLTYKFGGCK